MMARLLLLTILFGITSLSRQHDIVGRRVVEGVVYDAETLEPLVGANIQAIRTSWGAASDNRGMYSFAGALPDTVWVRVTYVGYSPATVAAIFIGGGSKVVLSIGLTSNATLEIPGEYLVVPTDWETILMQYDHYSFRLPPGIVKTMGPSYESDSMIVLMASRGQYNKRMKEYRRFRTVIGCKPALVQSYYDPTLDRGLMHFVASASFTNEDSDGVVVIYKNPSQKPIAMKILFSILFLH